MDGWTAHGRAPAGPDLIAVFGESGNAMPGGWDLPHISLNRVQL
jgi:hypothetical protein